MGLCMNGIAMVAGMELHAHLSTSQIRIVPPLPPAAEPSAITWQVDLFRPRYISWVLVCLPCLQSPDKHHYPVARSVLFIIMGFPVITPGTRNTLKSERGVTKRTIQDLLISIIHHIPRSCQPERILEWPLKGIAKAPSWR